MPTRWSHAFVALLLFLPLYAIAQTTLGISIIGKSAFLNLPYATYGPAYYNSSGKFYLFRNIRFAAPPLGELRWAPPAEPQNETAVQDGSYGPSCFQEETSSTSQSEDCLFLDVYVPAYAAQDSSSYQLPVLFFLYGGGYSDGDKDGYDPSGLLAASKNTIIFVRANYRLGPFGFLAGSDFQSQGGVANLGLLDQLAAMQWIQKYIYFLGGDANSITAAGWSAGAGSLLFHLSSNSTLPFAQAILASAGYNPLYDNDFMNSQFNNFTLAAGCPQGDLACLKNASSSSLGLANDNVHLTRGPGGFGFGPAIDGEYVKELPAQAFFEGRANPNVRLLVGHTSNESYIFDDSSLETMSDSAGTELLRSYFPNASSSVLDEITGTYYPIPSRSDGRYINEFGRFGSFFNDYIIDCHALYAAKAYGNNTYNYRFSAADGYHGQDIEFIFSGLNNFAGETVFVDPSYANAFRSYWISFINTGNPNSDRAQNTIQWPTFGSNKQVLDMSSSGFHILQGDPDLPNDRCTFWQIGLYSPETTVGTQSMVPGPSTSEGSMVVGCWMAWRGFGSVGLVVVLTLLIL